MPFEDQDSGEGAAPDVAREGATVDIQPDPPAGGEGGDPGAGNQPRPSRAERRAARGEDYAALARAAQERAERAEQAAQRNAEALAELRGRMSAGEQQRQAAQPDPDDAEFERLQDQIENALARMGQGDTEARKEWRSLVKQQTILAGKIAARAEGKGIEERITKAIPQQLPPETAALFAEYPQLADDKGPFRAIANGHIARLIATEKRDMGNPTVAAATRREAAALAAKDLGIGGKAGAPSDVERGRIAGTGGRDSGAGNETTKVRLTAAQEELAVQMFRTLPREQAMQMWWKQIGSKIQNANR